MRGSSPPASERQRRRRPLRGAFAAFASGNPNRRADLRGSSPPQSASSCPRLLRRGPPLSLEGLRDSATAPREPLNYLHWGLAARFRTAHDARCRVIRLGDARLLDGLGAVGAQAAAASVRRARYRLASAKSANTCAARSWRCRDSAPCDSRTGISGRGTRARPWRAPRRSGGCARAGVAMRSRPGFGFLLHRPEHAGVFRARFFSSLA